MKICVRVTANSRKAKVIAEENNVLKVWVNAPAIEGKANTRLLEILTGYYKKPLSSFRIISGLKNRNKIVEIVPIAGKNKVS